MKPRFQHFLAEALQLLHPEQMGGRPGRSAVDAALLLRTIVDLARNKGLTVTALIMDDETAEIELVCPPCALFNRLTYTYIWAARAES